MQIQPVARCKAFAGFVLMALKALSRAPTFTAIAIATLALCIGANTVVFTVISSVVLRPLSYPDPDKLVSLGFVGQFVNAEVPYSIFEKWRAGSRSFEQLGAYIPTEADLVGGARPLHVHGAVVTASWPAMFGFHIAFGRPFESDEERPGSSPVVLLSHSLWMSGFGGDSSVVGRNVVFQGQSATIVGVLPPAADFPADAQFWTQSAFPESPPGPISFVNVVGRLKPGVAASRAVSELLTMSQIPNAPDFLHNATLQVQSLHERMYGDTRAALRILFIAVLMVLLVGCANLASLSLAREAARSRDIAVRTALGATPANQFWRVLAEIGLVAAAGGVGALMVVVWAKSLFTHLIPADLLKGRGVEVDGRVLAFTVVISFLAAIGASMAPAIWVSRMDVGEVLKGAGWGSQHGTRGLRVRRALVTAELAAAYVLLIGASLLMHGLARFTSVDPGFQPAGLIGLRVDLTSPRYADASVRGQFYGDVLRRVSKLPNVTSAAIVTAPPLGGIRESRSIQIDGLQAPRDGLLPEAVINSVSANYFVTAGVALLEGRDFTPADRFGAAPVALVNRTFAQKYLGGKAIGHQITMPKAVPDHATVVGIVGDVRQRETELTPAPEIFLSASQRDDFRGAFVIRARAAPSEVMSQLPGVVQSVDPLQPVSRLFLFKDELESVVGSRKLNAGLLGGFALVALALGVMGMYGTASQAVVQRAREIGVRAALGASSGDLVALVVWGNMRAAFVGLALGLPTALVVGRLLGSVLFQLKSIDPVAVVLVTFVLLLTTVIATLVPALRAAKLDPMTVINSE
jgi:putative ABC transport system permease protein